MVGLNIEPLHKVRSIIDWIFQLGIWKKNVVTFFFKSIIQNTSLLFHNILGGIIHVMFCPIDIIMFLMAVWVGSYI